MNKLTTLIRIIALGAISFIADAAPANNMLQPAQQNEVVVGAPPVAINSAPTRKVTLSFSDVATMPGDFTLTGMTHQDRQIEFSVRNDEVVTQAVLNLQFTPSPSLIPILSQIKVYLNEELMGVVTITQDQLGHSNRIQIPLDSRYVADFNRVKLSFIGHYTKICENPANSTIWADISKSSDLTLMLQTLPLQNELAHFPQPFYDSKDTRPLMLPMVFPGEPGLTQQRAAAILASWFGAQAKWTGQSFPALFNRIPTSNAIVFATNSQKPDFLKNIPNVNAPTLSMINHPNNPYIKILLVMGRDDNDLITAVKGIANGNILFRGPQVTVDKVEQLAPRKPYDAPNWIHTDRLTTFAEVQQFKDQLETSGITPYPLSLSFGLPPDLYMQKIKGINMHLIYKYTIPSASNISRLNINLNDSFVRSYELTTSEGKDPSVPDNSALHGLFNTDKNVTLPSNELQPNNKIGFDFDYSVSVFSLIDHCEVNTLTRNHAIIDGLSTLDFTHLYHYVAMPNLQIFSQAGFPYSRLADLSETLVLVKPNAGPEQVSILLNTLGNIGARIGYPALSMSLTYDWSQAKNKDDDILIIGDLPSELRDINKMNLLMQATQSWVKEPLSQGKLQSLPINASNAQPENQTTVSADGPMAAIVGVQSPFNKQRSIIALLADSPKGFGLLNDTLISNKKLGLVYGSVAVIRESGVNSLQVGTVYHVGHLPWWMFIWYELQSHPIALAIGAIFLALLIGLIIWRGLSRLSRRRLFLDKND